MRLLLFAAVTDIFVVMLEFLFQKTAASVAGPAFRRTAADVAVTGAFPGDRMGHSWGFHRQRRERAHDDQSIDHGEKQSDYGAGWFFHSASRNINAVQLEFKWPNLKNANRDKY